MSHLGEPVLGEGPPDLPAVQRGTLPLGTERETVLPGGASGGGALSRVVGSCRTGWEPPLGDRV